MIITSKDHALAYVVDCTLATIEGYLDQKRPPKGELKRQIDIVDKVIGLVDPHTAAGTRIPEVATIGTAIEWARRQRPDLFPHD